MLKVVSRLHAAARKENVSGADHRSVPKGHSDVEIIIFLQKGIFNDVEDVPLMGVPELVHQLCRYALQLVRQPVLTGNFKAALQRRRHRVPMFRPVLPKERAARILAAACVRYIKYIFQSGPVADGVNEGNSLTALPHIPAHLIVPQLIVRAGRGLRALGKNHELFMVGVLIQPRSGCQKGRPLLVAAGDLLRCVVCHLCVEL